MNKIITAILFFVGIVALITVLTSSNSNILIKKHNNSSKIEKTQNLREEHDYTKQTPEWPAGKGFVQTCEDQCTAEGGVACGLKLRSCCDSNGC